MRKTDEYIMQLAIITNPHIEEAKRKEFVDGLMNERRYMRGEPEAPTELDVAMFEKFRTNMSKESLNIKVK